MPKRSVLLMAAAGVAIAAVFFLLGAFVFPQTRPSGTGISDARTDASNATTDTAALQGYGIIVPESATATASTTSSTPRTPSDADAAARIAPLDPEALASLSEPTVGHLVGTVTRAGDPNGTLQIRVTNFQIVVEGSGTSTERRSVPAGSLVTVAFQPEGSDDKLPEVGRTVMADVRVEAAAGGRPGRIAVVRIQVMGSND